MSKSTRRVTKKITTAAKAFEVRASTDSDSSKTGSAAYTMDPPPASSDSPYVPGESDENESSWLGAVKQFGWVSLIFLVIGLIVTATKEYVSINRDVDDLQIKSTEMRAESEKLSDKVDGLDHDINALRIKQISTEKDVEHLKEKGRPKGSK